MSRYSGASGETTEPLSRNLQVKRFAEWAVPNNLFMHERDALRLMLLMLKQVLGRRKDAPLLVRSEDRVKTALTAGT